MHHPLNAKPGESLHLAHPYLSPILDFNDAPGPGLYHFQPPGNLEPVLFFEREQAWALTRHRDVKALLHGDGFKDQQLRDERAAAAPQRLQGLLDETGGDSALFEAMNDPARAADFLEKVRTAAQAATRRKLANMALHKGLGSAFQYAYGVSNRAMAELFQIPDRHLSVFIKFARSYIDLTTHRKALSDEERFHGYENLDIGLELIGGIDGNDLARPFITPEADAREVVLALLHRTLCGGLDLAIQLIAGGLYLCARHERERIKLEAEHRWDNLPAELYRYFSPTRAIVPRIACRDQKIGGRCFAKGSKIYPLIAAANRDRDVFEHPNRFDIGRDGRDIIFYDEGGHTLGRRAAFIVAEVALKNYFGNPRLAS